MAKIEQKKRTAEAKRKLELAKEAEERRLQEEQRKHARIVVIQVGDGVVQTPPAIGVSFYLKIATWCCTDFERRRTFIDVSEFEKAFFFVIIITS